MTISFHKTIIVKYLIEPVSCKLLYLPTYSLDLNLIKHYWFKVKNDACKVTRLFNDFFDTIFYTLKYVTTFLKQAILPSLNTQHYK